MLTLHKAELDSKCCAFCKRTSPILINYRLESGHESMKQIILQRRKMSTHEKVIYTHLKLYNRLYTPKSAIVSASKNTIVEAYFISQNNLI